ncbi:hypothetical protein [Spirosoma areae]
MNTQSLINLEVSLEELVNAFKQLPANQSGQQQHHAIKFALIDDYGNPCERELLFRWNQPHNDWELNTKGHDLLITASVR